MPCSFISNLEKSPSPYVLVHSNGSQAMMLPFSGVPSNLGNIGRRSFPASGSLVMTSEPGTIFREVTLNTETSAKCSVEVKWEEASSVSYRDNC